MQRQIRPCLFPKSLICIVCCVSIAISTSRALALESQSDSSSASTRFSEQRFEDEVKEYLGAPYRKGGTSRKGFDCSGFARTVYDRLLGIDLPHSSGDQFYSSELQKIDTRKLKTGDLVFFAGGKKKKRINHVGVYLSDGEFIHASSSEGVIVSSLDEQYWKKRYVGSKRHMALSSVSHQAYRFESYLETPALHNSLLTFYSRDEFNANSPSPDDPGVINYEPFETGSISSAPQNFHEIGYSQTLLDGFDVSISAFTEKFDSNNAWPGSEPASLAKGFGIDETFSTSLRQGLTLSSDYRPSSWLSFTPSVTYFDHSGNNEHLTNVPKRTFGLNTQLSPMDNSWSLSMLVQYTDGENLSNISNFDSNISSMDMAIKLGVALTENLQFSIISKHDKRSMALRMLDDSSLNQSTSRDVAMVFDFSY